MENIGKWKLIAGVPKNLQTFGYHLLHIFLNLGFMDSKILVSIRSFSHSGSCKFAIRKDAGPLNRGLVPNRPPARSEL